MLASPFSAVEDTPQFHWRQSLVSPVRNIHASTQAGHKPIPVPGFQSQDDHMSRLGDLKLNQNTGRSILGEGSP